MTLLSDERKGAPAPPQTYGAFELKFTLPEDLVAPVVLWSRAHLGADPFAGEGDTYEVNSVYLDRDDLSVYHRAEGFDERKYRVRRYGNEGLVYLEEKEKIRGWVRKRRTPVADADLGRLDEGTGAWFADLMRREGLAPKSQVAYRRIARVGETEGRPIRLTIDRRVRCVPAFGLAVAPVERGLPIERSILELKFGRGGLPALYKRLVAEFGLSPASSSKYRLSVEVTGLARERVAA